MSNPTPVIKQRVRFEEVTPANTVVAFFATQLQSLAAWLQIPIFDGYDDLDEMQFTFLTLASGHTVTLQEYAHSPQAGMNLHIDNSIPNVSAVVFEACQRLEIPRSKVIWFHPDFQEEIDRLYVEHGDITETNITLETTIRLPTKIGSGFHSIYCFSYALDIYNKQEFPQYWAMLQHNFGLAYFDRLQGDHRENLERSIECFQRSLLIYTQEDFPKEWKINQDDLARSQKSLERLKEQNLVAK